MKISRRPRVHEFQTDNQYYLALYRAERVCCGDTGGRFGGVLYSHVHMWTTLCGRVSIKEGSTMKKIGGPQGQVGGGQQGEVTLNGNSTSVCV